jgi:hypothetical protein
MLKSIHLLVAKRDAEIRLVAMSANDPFRSAYEDFLAGVDEWINFYEKLEG